MVLKKLEEACGNKAASGSGNPASILITTFQDRANETLTQNISATSTNALSSNPVFQEVVAEAQNTLLHKCALQCIYDAEGYIQDSIKKGNELVIADITEEYCKMAEIFYLLNDKDGANQAIEKSISHVNGPLGGSDIARNINRGKIAVIFAKMGNIEKMKEFISQLKDTGNNMGNLENFRALMAELSYRGLFEEARFLVNNVLKKIGLHQHKDSFLKKIADYEANTKIGEEKEEIIKRILTSASKYYGGISPYDTWKNDGFYFDLNTVKRYESFLIHQSDFKSERLCRLLEVDLKAGKNEKIDEIIGLMHGIDRKVIAYIIQAIYAGAKNDKDGAFSNLQKSLKLISCLYYSPGTQSSRTILLGKISACLVQSQNARIKMEEVLPILKLSIETSNEESMLFIKSLGVITSQDEQVVLFKVYEEAFGQSIPIDIKQGIQNGTVSLVERPVKSDKYINDCLIYTQRNKLIGKAKKDELSIEYDNEPTALDYEDLIQYAQFVHERIYSNGDLKFDGGNSQEFLDDCIIAAVELGSVKMFHQMVKLGASIEAKDKEGKDLSSYAEDGKCLVILQYLANTLPQANDVIIRFEKSKIEMRLKKEFENLSPAEQKKRLELDKIAALAAERQLEIDRAAEIESLLHSAELYDRLQGHVRASQYAKTKAVQYNNKTKQLFPKELMKYLRLSGRRDWKDRELYQFADKDIVTIWRRPHLHNLYVTSPRAMEQLFKDLVEMGYTIKERTFERDTVDYARKNGWNTWSAEIPTPKGESWHKDGVFYWGHKLSGDDAEKLPMPVSVSIYEAWHWAPLSPDHKDGFGMSRKILAAGGVNDDPGYYYQDGRHAIGDDAIKMMTDFVEQLTTYDAARWKLAMARASRSGPGMIDAIRNFCRNEFDSAKKTQIIKNLTENPDSKEIYSKYEKHHSPEKLLDFVCAQSEINKIVSENTAVGIELSLSGVKTPINKLKYAQYINEVRKNYNGDDFVTGIIDSLMGEELQGDTEIRNILTNAPGTRIELFQYRISRNNRTITARNDIIAILQAKISLIALLKEKPELMDEVYKWDDSAVGLLSELQATLEVESLIKGNYELQLIIKDEKRFVNYSNRHGLLELKAHLQMRELQKQHPNFRFFLKREQGYHYPPSDIFYKFKDALKKYNSK